MTSPTLTGAGVAATPQTRTPVTPVRSAPRLAPAPDVTRGHDCGPWDVSETDPVRGRHQLEGRLHLEHLDITVPHGARPHLEFAGEGDDRRAVGARLDLPPVPDDVYRHYLAISVLAAPISEKPWSQWMAENHRNSCISGGVPTVETISGPFGPETLAVADNQESLTIGVDGPKWTVLATVYGARVTSAARDQAHQVLADLVVHRGTAPQPAGGVLSISPVNPPEPVWTPNHPNYRGESR